jgi:hypothetical protein
MIIAIFVEKISSIFQNARVNLIGNRHNLAVNYITRRYARSQGRSLSRQVGSQVDQVPLQYSKPGYVRLQDIGARATLLQEFARKSELVKSLFLNSAKMPEAYACFPGKLSR